MFDNFL